MTMTGRNRNRTRAIRALMAAEGLKYTAAARALDEGRMKLRTDDGREYTVAPDGGTVTAGPPIPDAVRSLFFLSPGEEITDPDRAEALGLTADARRMRADRDRAQDGPR